MNSKVKAFILILIIVGVALMMPSFMENTTKAADEAEWSEEGTEEFFGVTIVEIVPYKGMGEIGYLIGGQEPVDEELMDYNPLQGQFSIAGGAVTICLSYTDSEFPETSNTVDGNAASGWMPAITYVSQNGYFEYVSSGGRGLYSKTDNQTIYERVPDGTGTHQAVLPNGALLEIVHNNSNDVVNRKNVIAYFSHEIPSDSSLLFSQTIKYNPYSVTAVNDNTGDYDYNPESKRFILNKGNGAYDVIFEQKNVANPYYMYNDYEIVEDNSGDYSYTLQNNNYISQPGGDYKQTIGVPTFTFERYWGGNYRWVQNEAALSKANFAVDGNKIWVQAQKIWQRYQYKYLIGLLNNEWFKINSLGIPADQVNDYPVRVITITPEELNNPINHHYIDEANLFYIAADTNMDSANIYLYENFSYEGQSIPSSQKYANDNNKIKNYLNFAVHDINWTVTDKLFRKIAGIGCHKASAIINNTFYFDAINGTSNAYKTFQKNNINISINYNTNRSATSINMAKLYIMINQRNKIDFYNSFMNPATTEVNHRITPLTNNDSPTGSTASFVRPFTSDSATSNQAIYWNGNTFLPFGLNADGVMTEFTSDTTLTDAARDIFDSMGIENPDLLYWESQFIDIIDNVLTFNGSSLGGRILGSNFLSDRDVTGDAQDDGDEYYDESGSNFSIGDLTNIITNDGAGYEDTGGVSYPDGDDVEGVPSEESEDGTDERNQRTYKRVLNIQPTAYFTASEADIRAILSKHDVQIVNMTSMQFNGCIEDINNRYDMIYMGSGMLNDVSYNRYNMNNNKTDFNYATLDSYFYSKVGDTMKLATTGEPTVHYRSNDITAKKKSELESYRNAGYPIVLDYYLYKLTDTTARVKSDTLIYSFVNQSKSHSNLLNMANFNSAVAATKKAFTKELKNCLKIVRPIIDTVEPVMPDGVVVFDPATDILTIKFKLLPKSSIPSAYYYNAYLYVDKNRDGIFDETNERITVSPSEASSYENIRERVNINYIYNYTMSGLNGVYQWKIKIVRADNFNIRGTVTGYFKNITPKDLYILQITDNAASYNLEDMVIDTQKLINTYAGQGKISDYNLIFETLTVSDYQEKFDDPDEAFDILQPAATSKLSKYHVLILDNPNIPIDPDNGTVANIKYEIGRNLGVIFTKNALGYDNQKDYFNTGSISFMDHTTARDKYTYTYNYINRNSYNIISGSQLYSYRNMVGDYGTDLLNDAAYQSTYLTKTNDGTITKYPYQIGKAIKITANSYSNDAVIDYDLMSNQRLIGWYCLSDSRSPVVRDELEIGGDASSINFGTYSTSPNDVKNNYYLFSNGSCYYSGIQLATADQAGNTEEMKLFVNTILATHHATSGRVISIPPTIEILKPTPAIVASIQTITLENDDFTGNDLILGFRVLGGPADTMDLDILMGEASEPEVDWDDIAVINKSGVTFSVGPTVHIGSSRIEAGIYVVTIPRDQLLGSHILKLKATNLAGNSVTNEVTLIYFEPPVVTIVDPVPLSNASAQYINVDIDYSTVESGEDYLNREPQLRVEFKVEHVNPSTTFYLGFTSGVDSLTDGELDDVEVYRMNGVVEDTTELVPGELNTLGSYALYIPALFIKDLNIRDLTITATDTGQTGEANIVILRRSLFPLD